MRWKLGSKERIRFHDELREEAPLTVVEAEAIAEANALGGPAITDLEVRQAPRARRWPWLVACVFVLVGLGLAHWGAGAALLPLTFKLSDPVCHFSDGSTRPGTCMFEEEWVSLDTSKWNAPPRFWEGPTQQVANGGQCFDPGQVSASSGVLHLGMASNASTCPATWDCSGAYYTTNYGTNWPCPLPGQASTSYDMGLVQTKLFKYRYGTIEFTAKMPAGVGPGAEVGLWSDACMSARGVIPEGNETFFGHNGTYPSGCLFPSSNEIDLLNYLHQSGNVNSTMYVDNSVGSPTLIGSFGGANYYGAQWSNQTIGGATQLFLNGNPALPDLSLAFHTYKVHWTPTTWAFYIDGAQKSFELKAAPTWISSQMAFLVLWIGDAAAVTGGTLPQDFQVGPVKVWCEPGDPCAWSGGL